MRSIVDTARFCWLLSRLTARSRRRWWSSVGLVFVVAIAGLTLYRLYLELRPPPTSVFFAASYAPEFSQRNVVLPCAVILLAAVLWFLAALHTKLSLASALEGLPLEASSAGSRAIFLLMARDGWLPCLAVTLVSLPYSNYAFWDALRDSSGTFYSSTAGQLGHSLAAFPLGMLWVLVLLCALRRQQWIVAAAWLIVLVLLPVGIELLQGQFQRSALYIPPAAPLYYRSTGAAEWTLAYLICLALAVTMLRLYVNGRSALAHCILGLFLAGAALSALDKHNVTGIYLPRAHLLAHDQFAKATASTAAGILALGRFPQEVPLHQYWTGPDGDRRVAYRIPLVSAGEDRAFAWQLPVVAALLWVPALTLLLFLAVPLLVNRQRFPLLPRRWLPIMRYADRPAL